MLHFEPKELPSAEVHRMMLGGIGPRPIALVSTLSEDGIPNLTPFSFFNAFGSNPPVIAFSPARRGRDASFKDTYNNLVKTRECVVQSVTYPMVEQISLASSEYPPEVDEFVKTGLTPVESDLVKPKRVKESPFQMECKVIDIISVGSGGGSANICICEVVKFHIARDIFRDGIIHPDLIDLVGRMSANFYSRAGGPALFEVAKPGSRKGIGYDQLPSFIKDSDIYSANNTAMFAGIESIPAEVEVGSFINEIRIKEIKEFESSVEAFFRYKEQNNYLKMLKAVLCNNEITPPKKRYYLELTSKCALENNDLLFAWKTAIHAGSINI